MKSTDESLLEAMALLHRLRTDNIKLKSKNQELREFRNELLDRLTTQESVAVQLRTELQSSKQFSEMMVKCARSQSEVIESIKTLCAELKTEYTQCIVFRNMIQGKIKGAGF